MVTFFKLCGIVFVLTLIVPLMVWGGSGSWRHGLHAWLSYLKIMGAMVALGGGFGLLQWLAERIG